MKPYYADESVRLFHGDCLDVLREMPDASVDAVVTDPPYGLEFMGKAWDRFDEDSRARAGMTGTGYTDGAERLERPSFLGGLNPKCRTCGRWQRGGNPCRCDAPDFPNERRARSAAFGDWCEQWATECLRVLKPGGHMLAFGGTRTWHRLACAVEDAGFEVRDSIAWLYGSGFPKSLDVSKAIDKAAGAEREVVGSKLGLPGYSLTDGNGDHRTYGRGLGNTGSGLAESQITAPATPDAERWQGWGTALRPSFEPIVVGRKPLSGTVASNVLTHGTGAINVDACRTLSPTASPGAAGRWPANVLLDGSQADALDTQSGPLHTQATNNSSRSQVRGATPFGGDKAERVHYGLEAGGASRFFPTFRYEAKAPTAERPTYARDGAGTGRVTGLGGKVRQCNVCETRAIESGAGEPSCGHGDFRWEEPTNDSSSRVAHPTVKPLDLMRWLVRLVTPPGGTVLEPFAGSGTTAEACVLEGFQCIAIEREADYLPLIVQRLSKPLQVGLGLDFGDTA